MKYKTFIPIFFTLFLFAGFFAYALPPGEHSQDFTGATTPSYDDYLHLDVEKLSERLQFDQELFRYESIPGGVRAYYPTTDRNGDPIADDAIDPSGLDQCTILTRPTAAIDACKAGTATNAEIQSAIAYIYDLYGI